VVNAITQLGLKSLWLLGLVSWNLPWGPNEEEHRFNQLRECLTSFYQKNSPRTSPSFQFFAKDLAECYRTCGHVFSSEMSVEDEVWSLLKRRTFGSRTGRRCNLNRLQGSLYTCQQHIGSWAIDLYERLLHAMEVALSKFFAFQLDREWTDIHTYGAAAMQMKPMPKVPLHTLFAESQTGPYSVPPWTNKKGTQRFADLCAEVYKDFEDERAKLSAGDKTAEEVKEALATLDSARRRASMDKARLKAQETLQAKRQRRTIVLDSKAGAASGSVAPA